MNQLFLALLLSILPISELRAAIPLAVDYTIKNSIPFFPVFFFIVLLNALVIFPIFFFLDFFHHKLMNISLYKRIFGFYLRKLQKRVDKIERKMPKYGYFALALFVAVPLPATGVWTGTLIAWILGLERKKSIEAIILGVMIAGIIVLSVSLGFFGLANLF